jgi:hypothetical protein
LVVDTEHLRAHRRDFRLPIRQILVLAARRLNSLARPSRTGRAARDHVSLCVIAPAVVGLSGLVRADRRAFWAFRRGRHRPSHLTRGRKRRTRALTIHGRWVSRRRFRVDTNAGRPAPREIHDPRLRTEELDEAIAFWASHAIVVQRGDFSRTPGRRRSQR